MFKRQKTLTLLHSSLQGFLKGNCLQSKLPCSLSQFRSVSSLLPSQENTEDGLLAVIGILPLSCVALFCFHTFIHPSDIISESTKLLGGVGLFLLSFLC